MIDDDTLLLLNAYHDGELSPGEALAIERRLAGEPELRDALETLRRLSTRLATDQAVLPLPEGLQNRLLANIPAEADPGVEAGRTPAARRQPRFLLVAASLVAGILIGAAGMGGLNYFWATGADARATIQAVLDGHLRSLTTDKPFEIASGDGHTVKPWFNGRTTIAPNAPDISDQGFPLAGGRVDVINGETVPTLVYRRNRHFISVTVTPRTQTMQSMESRDGSTILSWNDGDLTYWAISDVNPGDLGVFVDLFRQRSRPGEVVEKNELMHQ